MMPDFCETRYKIGPDAIGVAPDGIGSGIVFQTLLCMYDQTLRKISASESLLCETEPRRRFRCRPTAPTVEEALDELSTG